MCQPLCHSMRGMRAFCAAAAVNVVVVVWGADPAAEVAIVAAKPNRTEVAAEPNQNGGVIVPAGLNTRIAISEN